MKSSPFQTVQEKVGHEFSRILPLGDEAGGSAFLGCRPAGGGLAILLLRPDENGRERLDWMDRLHSDVPVGITTCPVCGATQPGWPRYCAECRADLAEPLGRDAETGEVVPGGLEMLGEMQRRDGGTPLRFAREVATGRVAGLAARRGPAGETELVPLWRSAGGSKPVPRVWKAVAAMALVVAVAALAYTATAGEQRNARPAKGDDTSATALNRPKRDSAPVPVATLPPRTGDTAAPPGSSQPPAGGIPGGNRTKSGPDAPPSTRPRPPVAPPPAPTPQGVEAAIGGYAAAVGSGQTGRIRRAYPGITAAEVERWTRFFAPLGPDAGLRSSYEIVNGPTLDGNRAEVIFTLTLNYADDSGRRVERPLPLRAVLRWTGTAWSLQEVLLLQ